MSWQIWLNRQFVKVMIWAVCVVGVAALSSFALYISDSVTGQLLTEEQLFGGGELLMVVAAVAADAIGRLIQLFYNALFPASPGGNVVKVYAAHFYLLIAAAILFGTAAMYYVSVVTRLNSYQTVQVVNVLESSKRFLWSAEALS